VSEAVDQHLSAIYDILQQPPQVAEHLSLLDMYTGQPPGAEPLKPVTDDILRELIDPQQPTIGLRLPISNNYGKALAIASQQLRLVGEPACNIILLPELAYGQEAYDDTHYAVQRGTVVDYTGQTYGGDFPQPVTIDVLTSWDNPAVHDAGVVAFLNTPWQEAQFDDKLATKIRLQEGGIPTPVLLASDVSPDDPVFQRFITQRMEAGQGSVIKPVDGSLGRGILIADPARLSVEAILTALRSARFADSRLFVEEQIIGPEARTQAGSRLDWNVRQLITGGLPIGAYARVGAYGEAINASRGAVARAIPHILRSTSTSPEQRTGFMRQLDDIGHRIGQIFGEAAYMGADMQPDQTLQAYVLEVNGERAGGLANIIKTSPDEPADSHAQAMARALRASFEGTQRPRAVCMPSADPITQESILQGIHFLRSDQLEATAAVAGHLRPILDELPSDQRAQAVEYLAGRFDEPDNGAIEHSIWAARQEAIRLLAAGSSHALEPFNRYADYDLTDLKRQADSARMLLSTLGVDRTLFIHHVVTMPAIDSTADARAYGRALALSISAAAQRDMRSMSIDAFHHFHAICTQYLQQPVASRRFPEVETYPAGSPSERAYIAGAFQYMHTLEMLIRDTDEVQEQLVQELDLSELTAPSGFAVAAHQALVSLPETARDSAEHYALFLSCLAMHGPIQAHAALSFLEENQAEQGWHMLLQRCAQYCRHAGVAADSPEEYRLSVLLRSTFQDISVADNAAQATAAYQQLQRELDAYPHLLDLLHPNVEHYLSDPANFTQAQ
jgi:glutathione synthase/RimK-type ligase-like ATP-grasp enzyme